MKGEGGGIKRYIIMLNVSLQRECAYSRDKVGNEGRDGECDCNRCDCPRDDAVPYNRTCINTVSLHVPVWYTDYIHPDYQPFWQYSI